MLSKWTRKLASRGESFNQPSFSSVGGRQRAVTSVPKPHSSIHTTATKSQNLNHPPAPLLPPWRRSSGVFANPQASRAQLLEPNCSVECVSTHSDLSSWVVDMIGETISRSQVKWVRCGYDWDPFQ